MTPTGPRVCTSPPCAAEAVRAPLAAVVLAGGAGVRMGGGKPARRLAGFSLLEHAITIARADAARVAVAVRSPDQIASDGVERILDDPAIEGPLAGLAAAISWARGASFAAVLTLPCDAPFLPPGLGARLAEAMGAGRAAMAACAGRLYPTIALWRTDLGADLPGYAAGGGRSLRGFAEAIGAGLAPWPDRDAALFANINTPEDLAAAEAWLAAFGRGRI